MRKPDVTASTVGALYNAHPYMSALKLYLEKTGVDFPHLDSSVTRRGRLLESAVALAVGEERPEWTITKNKDYYRDTSLRLGATPDFFIEGDPRGLGVLQTKTAAPHIYKRDWEGGKSIPLWISLQVLTECILTDAAFGVVAVLQVDAFDLAVSVLEIERNPDAERRIINSVRQFWIEVAQGREPAPDYGKDAELIPYLMAHVTKDKTIDLQGNNELPALLAQRAELMGLISKYEKRVDEIETEIKFDMRDAERITAWTNGP